MASGTEGGNDRLTTGGTAVARGALVGSLRSERGNETTPDGDDVSRVRPFVATWYRYSRKTRRRQVRAPMISNSDHPDEGGGIMYMAGIMSGRREGDICFVS